MHDRKVLPRARQALNESNMAMLPQLLFGAPQDAVHMPPGKPTALRLHTMSPQLASATEPMRSRSRFGSWVTLPTSHASPTVADAGRHWPTLSSALASILEHCRPGAQLQPANVASWASAHASP